jgi:hypothetical protein
MVKALVEMLIGRAARSRSLPNQALQKTAGRHPPT